ncbi:MAG: B12-binding domain-containing radical SAM protein [Candidatus Omnitrophica bacterium]|nr:B12-binding domain-containing radical SAM protein [Candidatus Omnitrophota bacterium]
MKKLVYIIQAPPFWLKNPPLSLIYLRNYLEKKGIATGIIDLNINLFTRTNQTVANWLTLNKEFEKNLFALTEKHYPEILEDVYSKIKSADFVGFSLTKRNSHFSFSLAEKIKSNFPNKKIIFGGPEVLSLERKGKLDPRYYWVIGEGEMAFENIITDGKNKILRYQELADLDHLPFYDFAGLDASNYSKTLPLFSLRGCPHQCSFCSERLLYKKVRQHSVKYMLRQIKLLKAKYQTNSFVFLDSLINYRKTWLKNFCQSLINDNFQINWEAQIRVDKKIPLELAKLMKSSGCYNLFVGLESGSDKMLKKMNKGFDSANALSFFETLNKAGLHFEISLIFGYPGENEQDFQETLSFIKKHKKLIPKIAQANPFSDYLNAYPVQGESLKQAKQRVEKFLALVKKEKIRYTKSFINNLIY